MRRKEYERMVKEEEEKRKEEALSDSKISIIDELKEIMGDDEYSVKIHTLSNGEKVLVLIKQIKQLVKQDV
jgi:hypothetical protein